MNDFTEKIHNLYSDFAKRINISNWEALINEELRMNLATVSEISEQMLEFLLKLNNLPIEVWQFLDQTFEWTFNQEELKGSYPPAFIDFIVTQVCADIAADIKYHLFDTNTGKDFDRFIWLVRELGRYLDYRSLQGIENFMEELEDFGIDHPDYLMEKARILAIEGNPDEGLEVLDYIFDTYTEDYEASTYFKFVHAFVLATFNEQDKLEEAILLFEELLDFKPDDVTSKDGLADCYERIGDLDKAYQFTMDHILAAFPSDNYALQRLYVLAQKLLPIYQEKYESGDASEEDILKLVKYHRQVGKNEEALELLQDNLQLDDSHEYHRMLANIYATQRDSENAITYTLESIRICPSIFAYDTLTQALMAQRRFEEAFEAINDGIKLPTEGYDLIGKALLLDAKARIFYRLREYDEALVASDEALKVHDKIAHLYNTKAEILMRTNHLQEAMNQAIKSQNLLPYSLVPYEIQAEIYYLAYRTDDVLNIVKQAAHFKLPMIDKLAYYHALALRDQAQKENTDLQPILDMLLEIEKSETFTQLDQHLPEEGLFAKLLGQIAYTYWYKEEDDHALQYVLRAIHEANEFIEENVIANWYDFQASILEALKKHDEALEVSINALKKFPNYLPLLKRAGRLHSNNKNHEETLVLFEQAYKIDQKDEVIYDWLEYTYRMLKRNTEAMEISRKWLVATGSAGGYRALAWHHKQLQELDKELQTLQDALVQHPDNEHLLIDLAFHYADQNAFKKAVEIRSQVLKLYPDNTNVRIQLAYVLTCLGEHEGALEVIDVGLKKEPNKVAYYARRGMIFQDAKKPHEAIVAFEKAIQKIPQDHDRYWTEAELISRIGTIYFALLNDGKKALECRHKSVELKPDDDYYLELLGTTYEFYQKDDQKALDYYLQATQIKETAYALLAVGELKEKQGEEARTYYEKALVLHEINPVPDHNDYVTQARILMGLGDYDDALNHLEQAEEIMKNDGRNSCGVCACVYRSYARYYLRIDQLDMALEAVDKSLKLENGVSGNALRDEILEKMEG